MTITQTIDIPADRRIKVPNEVPLGRAIITFQPAPESAASAAAPAYTEEELDAALEAGECPICAKYLDKDGCYHLPPKALAGLEASRKESEAMERGGIPAKRFSSFEEFWDDLNSDDSDEMSADEMSGEDGE